MNSKRWQIIGVGEILWDLLPAGPQLGGAPANFVCHAQALSAEAKLISRIGHDSLGKEIMTRFGKLGLATGTIAVDDEAPTGTVSVELGADGQPRFTIHENVAWDRIEASTEALATTHDADAICFGSLGQRTRAAQRAIAALVSATRAEAWRIFDINLRPPFIDAGVIASSLELANVLKLNDQELPILAKFFDLHGEDRQQVAALAEHFALRVVALTRGSHGSLLFADGNFDEHPGLPVTVRDTVGAGDSFTAALAMGLLNGWPLEKIHGHAAAVAAYVCTQSGATPPLPEDLRCPFCE